MKVLIAEDEYAAAKNLIAILGEIDESIEVLNVLESVSECVDYFNSSAKPDLAFFDIQLSDDIVFKVFDKCEVNCPVIFTTAYNQYAVRAFKVNSIDYILKPVNKDAVAHALDKFKSMRSIALNFSGEQILDILKEMRSMNRGSYRQSFLVQYKDRLIPLVVEDFAYFCIENGIVFGMTHEKKKHILDQKLESLVEELDPDKFFRANRQFIVSREAIRDLNIYFNGKLVLNVHPAPAEKIIVSKLKAPELKKWLGK
ncbi:MAG: LytTR family DNA-binding domain-containing protein [Bacteroidota bacterium]|nr:LytTR family DNA-binding domain-containing protein [Bacteroidota bacterium]